MASFHGFCSYPHGGYPMLGLTLSVSAGLASTIWGVSSCRFLYVDFQSDRGDFSEMFYDPTANGPPVGYRAGAGLFTYLNPFQENNWSEGVCVGYTQVHFDFFSDDMFEIARIFGVLSVLCACGIAVATLFLSCLSFARFQLWMFRIFLFLLIFFTGFTHFIFQSELCHNLVDFQGYDAPTCKLDQGGLVVVSATILWCVSFVIALAYIRPPDQDLYFANGVITNAFEERLQARKEKQLEIGKKRQEHLQNYKGGGPGAPSSSPKRQRVGSPSSRRVSPTSAKRTNVQPKDQQRHARQQKQQQQQPRSPTSRRPRVQQIRDQQRKLQSLLWNQIQEKQQQSHTAGASKRSARPPPPKPYHGVALMTTVTDDESVEVTVQNKTTNHRTTSRSSPRSVLDAVPEQSLYSKRITSPKQMMQQGYQKKAMKRDYTMKYPLQMDDYSDAEGYEVSVNTNGTAEI